METFEFDFIVIGGGSAGYAAARTARERVGRVAIVDGSDTLGGLCILRGCMPSKTLLHAADVLHHARHGDRLGLKIGEARADLSAIVNRKDRIIGEFADYRRGQLESSRFTLFRSRARFTGPDSVLLADGTRLAAPAILIATGSVTATPPVPGLDSIPCLTSDEILSLRTAPESILVLGGGVVACELAHYLNRTGIQVIQIQRSARLLSNHSPEAAECVEEAFRSEGIELFTGTSIVQLETTSTGGVRIHFTHQGAPVTREATACFNALGRRPATEGLDLDAAGVATDRGRIITDGWLRTSQPGIYAAGDCTGPHEIVHIAILQGETAARHATGRATAPLDYRDLLGVVFTDPQVATVGLSLEAIGAAGDSVTSADYPFNDHGKSIVMDETRGFVRLYADRTEGRLLRAECVGRDAGELIHAMTFPVHSGATAASVLAAPWYHPTLAEIWSYPLETLVEAITQA